MRLNINDWLDGRFLSLPGNPDKLDERIRIYEHSRIICLLCTVLAIGLLFFVTLSGKGINDNIYLFVFVIFVFMMVINVQTDIYTKILKLQRQQQNPDLTDAKPLSGTAKKSALSVIATIYGPALSALILGALFFMFYVMAG